MEDAFISWTDPEIKSNCPKLVIYGVKNSYAQKYANKNNIPFKEIAAASQRYLQLIGIAAVKQSVQVQRGLQQGQSTVRKNPVRSL